MTPKCFIISPIGETGSKIRENADDLRDLIIKPAMEFYGFEVLRGDHHSEAGQIDIDVIRAVQECEVCVVDVSLPNPNVYYEFGRRDETGKPIILLKSKDSEELPVDIATRRYIEYDLDSRHGIRDAITQLKSFVEPIVKNGFESNNSGASLFEIAEVLKRLERKIDRIEKKSSSQITPSIDPVGVDNSDADPIDLFKLSLRQHNIPMAEKAMELLSYRMEKLRWLDQVVEQVAAMGSKRAGDIMIENAYEFIDSSISFHDKIDFVSCLVSNLSKTDREQENLDLVESICRTLKKISGNESAKDRVQPYNQLNRLYYGIYIETEDESWLQKSIDELKMAIEIDNTFSFLWYNLAICLNRRGQASDLEDALKYALRCVELDGDRMDDDHLETVCTLLHKTNDPRLSDYLSMLEKVNGIKAQLLRLKLGI